MPIKPTRYNEDSKMFNGSYCSLYSKMIKYKCLDF